MINVESDFDRWTGLGPLFAALCKCERSAKWATACKCIGRYKRCIATCRLQLRLFRRPAPNNLPLSHPPRLRALNNFVVESGPSRAATAETLMSCSSVDRVYTLQSTCRPRQYICYSCLEVHDPILPLDTAGATFLTHRLKRPVATSNDSR